ncbi:hypothetical protein BS50DRAFT_354192 [Corynespora cassiicola Philippines]|uniref:Uncharacterized protein n=1 Tax=Corynespora cassiicola Philippines TaxID=1448308 RepID=A0A2T2NRT6_CORCC|nr:hypothetical protein BS50DRAFT_354192 [Corynespora cassiicola Philippines]
MPLDYCRIVSSLALVAFGTHPCQHLYNSHRPQCPWPSIHNSGRFLPFLARPDTLGFTSILRLQRTAIHCRVLNIIHVASAEIQTPAVGRYSRYSPV